MKTNMLTKTVNNFMRILLTENRFILIAPEIRNGNKELDQMINNYYWNWEEYKN
jgi:hypothetical protein